MAGNLKRLRSTLREFKLISDSSRVPGQFQVIGIYCYSADSNFLKALTPPYEDGKEVILLYDILLTDNREKLKCFLALPLGHLVQKSIIKVGVHVQIQKAKMCYLEGEYNDTHIVEYVMLEALHVVEYTIVNFPPLENLQFVESTNQREKSDIPLVTGRKCYLNVWNPSVPSGEEWTDNSSLEYEESDAINNICLLQDLHVDWMRLPKPYPPIFIRIIARGILYHYGYNKNNASHPFMASLVIADSSAACSCILFGRILVPFYYSAQPGTILMVENYRIGKTQNFDHFPRLRGAAGNLPFLDMELVFNEFTKIKIVTTNVDLLQMQIAALPLVEFSFGNRASLELAAEGSTIDIVGLVTNISLLHRFIYKYGKLHARCYVEMHDSSSYLPFIAILYDNGLRYDLQSLHPGQVLVATHMKVCKLSDNLVSNSQIRIFLKATHFTEVYTSHRQESPYVRYPAVTAVASIIRDNPQEVEFIQNNMLRMGGIQMFVRGFKSLDSYKESFGNSLAGKMIPGAYWKVAIENLGFRERRFVTLGGFIVQVDYVDLQTVESPNPAYGWSYASEISSRQTLFINIKARSKLGNLPPLNLNQDDQFLFPFQYQSAREERFQLYQKFPPTQAAHWKPPANTQGLLSLVDGYFVIFIASLHYQALLQCIMIPEPSSKPHPSLIDALAGNLNVLPLRSTGSFLYEPPRYTWDEVKQISMTASAVNDRTFVFAVELHCTKSDLVQAHLQRAYVCPPEQLQEALAADAI